MQNIRNILIVDDNDIDMLIGTKLFEALDPKAKVSSFQSPEKALKFLSTAEELPELILLDLYMPRMSGIDFVMELKKLNLGTIPVVITSCSLQQQDIEASLRLPEVREFMSKPITREKVAQLHHNYSQIA